MIPRPGRSGPDQAARNARVAAGETVAAVAAAQGITRAGVYRTMSGYTLRAHYDAVYRRRWGEDPPRPVGPRPAEARAAVERLLGRKLAAWSPGLGPRWKRRRKPKPAPGSTGRAGERRGCGV